MLNSKDNKYSSLTVYQALQYVFNNDEVVKNKYDNSTIFLDKRQVHLYVDGSFRTSYTGLLTVLKDGEKVYNNLYDLSRADQYDFKLKEG